MKKNSNIVCSYRNGVAIRKDESWMSYYPHKEYLYRLVREDQTVLLDAGRWEMASIHRCLDGRYFVTAMKKYGYITFPGQDRDTEYQLRPIIACVLDEDGRIITEDHKLYDYIEKNPLTYTIELGEGLTLYADTLFDCDKEIAINFSPLNYIHGLNQYEQPRGDLYSNTWDKYDFLKYDSFNNTIKDECGRILCGSSVYDIESAKFLFNIPKKIEPLELFENGKCKVGVVSDYKDFIVVVSNSKIVSVYDVSQLGIIDELMVAISNPSDGDKKNNNAIKGHFSLPAGESVSDVININVEVKIENYLLNFPKDFDMWNGHSIVYNSNYAIERVFPFHNATKYFNVNGEWVMIKGINGQEIDKKIIETECNRPNFIKNIKIINSDISIKGRLYSIYKFECRPYGFITKDGKFDYNFDVNNIKW